MTDKLDAPQQALVVQWMPMACGLAHKFTHHRAACDHDDAVAEAHFGLVEAARRFDPTRGVMFPTYASYWIKAKLIMYCMRVWQGQVKHITTAEDRAAYFKLGKLRELEEGISDTDAAAMVGLNIDAVATARARFKYRDVSINAQDWRPVRDEQLVPQDESVITRERSGVLLRLIWQTPFTARERQIVRERLLVEDPRTLEALGDEWGVSRERVRQIEKQVVDKLKEAAGVVPMPPAKKRVRDRRRRAIGAGI